MRPRHVARAIETLSEVALTQRSPSIAADLIEVVHYVSRLEDRLLAERGPAWPLLAMQCFESLFNWEYAS